jgi:hypothetical protein
MGGQIGFICPTYNAIVLDGYTRKALDTFFTYTPDGVAIVVDDGSTGWTDAYVQSLFELAEMHMDARLELYHFPTTGGLTRSWNQGLAIADALDLAYVIAGNNDLVFSSGYYKALLAALDHGYDLVGPVSNAPGSTAKGKQDITTYLPNYYLTDDIGQINQVASRLQKTQNGRFIESPINGFFQLATMTAWRQGKYDATHYYCPVNTHTSKGKRNPTPLMTLNEDELQARWRAAGKKAAVVPGSFIFHYRSVSRGPRYNKGKWYRQCPAS